MNVQGFCCHYRGPLWSEISPLVAFLVSFTVIYWILSHVHTLLFYSTTTIKLLKFYNIFLNLICFPYSNRQMFSFVLYQNLGLEPNSQVACLTDIRLCNILRTTTVLRLKKGISTTIESATSQTSTLPFYFCAFDFCHNLY